MGISVIRMPGACVLLGSDGLTKEDHVTDDIVQFPVCENTSGTPGIHFTA
jgi:hypothetical protein